MNRYTYVLGGIVAVGMAAVLAGGVMAQTQGAELVKQRKTEMGQMGKAFGPLIAIVKGESEDFAAALESAKTMNTNAKRIVANFPARTGREAVPQSRAKPEIWTKRVEFEAAAAKLVEESEKLIGAVNSKDIQTFRTQFKASGAACGACHKGPKKSGGKFRFEEEL